jgi:putative ABC transport system ATP-binding protein
MCSANGNQLEFAVEAEGVSKTYGDPNGSSALASVTLRVESGEFVAITGPSGSGKSTLLNLIGGLDRPTSGKIRIDGTDISQLTLEHLAQIRNRRIGFVFQMFNLLPNMTLEENVALPAIIGGQRQTSYRPRALALLEMVGLGDKCGRFPAQLSGGEQQRVAVARALIMEPGLLLADEPTGNLDSKSGLAVLELLRDCHAQGNTLILITHDPRVAAQAQRVVFLRDGHLADESVLSNSEDRAKVMADMLRWTD